MVKDIASVFYDHWYIMFPIAFCSLAGMGIVAERSFTLWGASRLNKDELLNFIQSYCFQGQIQKRSAWSPQSKGPLSNIVRAGWSRL